MNRIKPKPVLSLFLIFLIVAGCRTAFRNNLRQPVTRNPIYNFSIKYMLFGGESHNTYLGCLNCSEYDSDSNFNKFW